MEARRLFAAGTVPDRADLEGELRWLRADAAAARRYFMRWGGHDAECRCIIAEHKVEKFLQAHPELDEAPRKGGTGGGFDSLPGGPDGPPSGEIGRPGAHGGPVGSTPTPRPARTSDEPEQ